MITGWYGFNHPNHPNINFKRLVLALLKSYRHHLLRDERNRLGAGFGMAWGWVWMALEWFGDGFVVFSRTLLYKKIL